MVKKIVWLISFFIFHFSCTNNNETTSNHLVQNKNTEPIKTKISQAIEIIRLKVKPEQVSEFLEGRKKVDNYVSKLKGYVSTEIVSLQDDEFILMVRWENLGAVKTIQKETENSSIISEWLKNAEFISFETTVVKYEN